MTFYLHPNAVLSLPETDRPVVTELSCRAKDAEVDGQCRRAVLRSRFS